MSGGAVDSQPLMSDGLVRAHPAGAARATKSAARGDRFHYTPQRVASLVSPRANRRLRVQRQSQRVAVDHFVEAAVLGPVRTPRPPRQIVVAGVGEDRFDARVAAC